MGKHEILPKRLDKLIVGDSDCVFRINVDVLNEAFGIGRAMYARGGYPDKQNTWIAGNKAEDKFFIWMPKLYGNSSEWQNSISEDGTEIYEIAKPTRNEDWTDTATYSTYQRIVFVKDSPKAPYRFVGVFENDSMEHLKHSYMRIATNVKLIGNPVYKIELLDDNRSTSYAIIPPFLYKYKSIRTIDDLFHLLDIIKNNRIYFPTYDILNDPLEGNIMEIEPSGYPGMNISRNADLEDKEVRNEKRHYYILSLSSKYNDPLMWAHYADNYAGVCLCYGSEHTFGEAQPVEYKNEREYYHSVEPKQLPALVRQGFYLKHNEWAYENEWRIVKRFDNKDDDKFHPEFFSYNQKELKGIIIGHNANPELIELLSDYLPKHVKVMKTYVGHRTYQIGILPIEAELQLNGSEPPYITDLESYLNQ